MPEITKSDRILVVDDDDAIRLVVRDRFRALGYETDVARDGDEALQKVEQFEPSLMLLDLRMPKKDGFGVLEALQKRESRPATIVITAHGSIEAAVKAIKMGAEDFISKPFEVSQLQHLVDKTLATERLKRRVVELETEVSGRHTLVLAESSKMQTMADTAARAAKSAATILLLGESGCGKEVLARFIHAQSERSLGPFAAVNCAALSKELLESELFGHEKGAFTGAVKSKPGRLEQAAGGTLFLDEIGELDAPVQAKLLRVLQEREFERLGGTRTLTADVRIICATHRDLPLAIREGRFREDLYYRINIVSLKIPPLRERQPDVEALLKHFLERHAKETGRSLALDDAALDVLKSYAWPGNVRELSNVVERMSVLATSNQLGIDDLPEEILEQVQSSRTPSELLPKVTSGDSDEFPSYHDAVLEAKRQILKQALKRCDRVQTRAAKLLGITQPYMARLMKNLGVNKNDV